MSAAAGSDAFLILGHGMEDVVNFNARSTIPPGYTLVTIEECGIVTLERDVCPMVEAFSKEENRAIFANPRTNKAAIEGFMNGKGIHVYTAGMKYPTLTIQFFLDWPSEHHTKVSKTGTYKFPLDPAAFQIGSSGTFHERMFKNIGPYKGFFEELPADFSADEMFSESIIPTLENVKGIVARTNSSRQVKDRLTIPLSDVFTAGGPGVYYYVVCRSPKLVISPEQLMDLVQFEGEKKARYTPYFVTDWISKIPEIVPLLQENSARTSHWIKAEIDSTLNDYRRMMRVPLIRQASINQQAAAATTGDARRSKSRNRRRAGRKSRRVQK